MRSVRSMLSVATAAVAIVLAAIPATRAGAAVADRSYGAAKMVLQLDQETRAVPSLEGGSIRADVVVEKTGKKHIGNLVVDPIRAKVGLADFTSLISASLANDAQLRRANGAMYMVSVDGKAISQREVLNAVVTQVSFPAIDASSKEPATLGIVLEPETTRDRPAGGAVAGLGGGSAKNAADRTILARAMINLPGVDASRVSKVDAITVTRKVSESPIGEMRDYEKTPGVWQVSNIVLTVPHQYANDFVKWHEDFVIKGQCAEQNEKTMTITALDQTGAPALTLNLSNVGIVSVAPAPAASGVDAPPQMRVELYAEKLTFGAGSGGSGGGSKAAGGTAAAPDPVPPPAPASPDAAGAPPAPPAGAAATSDATAAPAGPAGTTPAPAPAPAPTATPAPRKKRPAPTLTPVPAPGLPAPAEPVQKPRK